MQDALHLNFIQDVSHNESRITIIQFETPLDIKLSHNIITVYNVMKHKYNKNNCMCEFLFVETWSVAWEEENEE